jgi:drug/metabolite transporter (DMT)-like permease
MTWQLAIVISIVANVATILIQRRYAQRSAAPPSFPPAVSYVFGVLPIGLLAGFLVFPHAIRWSWWLVMLLALGGLSMAVSTWTGFRAARHLAVGLNQVIGRLTIVFTVLLGWTTLGEGLTFFQTLGAAILLAAALLAIQAPKHTTDTHTTQLSALTLSIISAIALAVALVTEKAVLGHMNIGGVFLVGWTTQALAMVVLAAKDARPDTLRQFRGLEFRWSALMGLVNGLTGVFYIYAIVHANNISLITSFTAIVLPLTVLGAFIFLGEREHRKIMWISLGISFVGLLVSAL